MVIGVVFFEGIVLKVFCIVLKFFLLFCEIINFFVGDCVFVEYEIIILKNVKKNIGNLMFDWIMFIFVILLGVLWDCLNII